MACEAVLYFKKSQENQEKDSGEFVKWNAVLAHFSGDEATARSFITKRRAEAGGKLGFIT